MDTRMAVEVMVIITALRVKIRRRKTKMKSNQVLLNIYAMEMA